MPPATSKCASYGEELINADIEAAVSPEPLQHDEMLLRLGPDAARELPAPKRLRWFYLAQVGNVEMTRVLVDLGELLDPCNEVKIISLIGMTGIGKTTLVDRLLQSAIDRYAAETLPHEVPIIVVKAPANGDRSLSWKVLYKRILQGGHDVLVNQKHGRTTSESGEVSVRANSRASLGELREFIDEMLETRNVRVLVIDEALHLIRFDDYTATMDTLKSLADSYTTKILLIGGYDIFDLVSEYGQVVRRGEIVHYRRYAVGEHADQNLTADQSEFIRILNVFEKIWPSKNSPALSRAWYQIMRATLGSVGLLKIALLRLLALQLRNKSEVMTAAMFAKAFKSPKALQQIEKETMTGEEKVKGSCYGDSPFDDLESVLAQVLSPQIA